jgi:ubiquinone/menaquinone biosynthesis C-methylase UbiE/DNA-binding transcriptional ArsR family regulator
MYQNQPMPSIVKTLRVLADPNRLRILLLLKADELSVAELQEILVMGQSTISTHLSQLKQAGLVEDRRTGKSSLYRLAAPTDASPAIKEHDVTGSDSNRYGPSGSRRSLSDEHEESGRDFSRAESSPKSSRALASEAFTAHNFLDDLLARASAEIPEAAADLAGLRRVVRKRQDRTRAFFDSVAGRLGRNYVPGKSWKSIAEALLRLMPPLTIADLGAGEGSFALLLARRARSVIAVDSSARMIEVGRDQALRNGVANVEFRLGEMEELPIASGEVDLAFFSQSLHHALHPERALAEAARILVPGGRIVLLDLAKHRFEEAREIYADEWLGFSESELEEMLARAGFVDTEVSIVDREAEPPHFQTLLAVATRPA